ncbi:MAG: hypothetical protein AAF480_14635, partial [Actinomycetota bacterium]
MSAHQNDLQAGPQPLLQGESGAAYSFLDVALTHNWIGGATGNWEVATNWDTGLVPDGDDTAIIPGVPAASVTVGADADVGVLVLGAGSDVDVASPNTLTITGGASNTASTVSGTLDVLDGADLTVQAPIDVISGGTLRVRGTAGFQDQVDILGQFSVTATGAVDVSDDLRMFGPDGDLIVTGQLVMAGPELFLQGQNTVTIDGTWRWSSATNQDVLLASPFSSVISATGTIEKAGAGTLNIPFGVDLDLDPGSVIDIQGGAFNVFTDGIWDGGASQITIQAATGTTMTWGGSQTLTGSIQGTGGTAPGRVTMSGTKTWGTPSSVANSLAFAKASASLDPANYMLDAEGVTFAGESFGIGADAVPGFLEISGASATQFNVPVTTITTQGTLATTGGAAGGAFNGSIGTAMINLGTVIAQAQVFGNGNQTFTNQGTVQFENAGGFISVNPTWVSSASSVLDVNAALVDMQAGHTELGLVQVSPAGRIALSNANTFAAGSV